MFRKQLALQVLYQQFQKIKIIRAKLFPKDLNAVAIFMEKYNIIQERAYTVDNVMKSQIQLNVLG